MINVAGTKWEKGCSLAHRVSVFAKTQMETIAQNWKIALPATGVVFGAVFGFGPLFAIVGCLIALILG